MQLSQFKSLSIGDSVYLGSRREMVTNVYMRVIGNVPVSFIELDNGEPMDERKANIIELGPHSKTFEMRSREDAMAQQQTLRDIQSQARNYPESIPIKFMQISDDAFMAEYEKRQ